LYAEKTGIGYYSDFLTKNLIERHPETMFLLEGFSSFGDDVKERARCFEAANAKICVSPFDRTVYRLFSALLPLPYRWFFPEKADVTHFFNFVIPPFVKGKKVVTVHDMSFKRFPEAANFKTRSMLNINFASTVRRADKIVTISQFSKREILKYCDIPEEKVEVIYCGVDKGTFRPDIPAEKVQRTREKYGASAPYFLYLGTLEPRKNIERVVEAYGVLRGWYGAESPSLVIAGGKGWMFDSIFKRVKDLGLCESVIFTGYIPDEDKPALISGAICFCFPSLYEGFGMPPLEAMACGVPVIVSTAASLPEVVGDAGLLVDPYSAEDIAGAMEKSWLDGDLRNELRDKGVKRADLFDWPNMAEKTYDVYKQLT
jgi:glycosyltransferase involved in cell wall biosynthesis